MSYTEIFVTFGVVSMAAFFVIRMGFRVLDTKRRIAEADERVRLRNQQFQAREAERHARSNAFAGKVSPLAGLEGGSRPQAQPGISRQREEAQTAAINARYQNATSAADMYPNGYNFAPAPAESHASIYHGNGGSFDGGGASGDWGGSSSSSSSDSCSSSSSSSDSGSSCSSSD